MEKKVFNQHSENIHECVVNNEENRDNSLHNCEEQQIEQKNCCDFEWSAIHLGAGLADDFLRKG